MTFHLYLDSADAADWRSWLPTRVFRGVTTNPTLMQRAGRPVTAGGVAQVLTELGPESGLGPALSVQVQAWGDTAEDMVALADAWGRARVRSSNCRPPKRVSVRRRYSPPGACR